MPLLSKWEEYLNTHPDGDIEGFARWILEFTRYTSERTTTTEAGKTVQTLKATPANHPNQPGQKPNAQTPSSHPNNSNPDEESPQLDTTAHSLLLINRIHRILQFRCKPIAKELGFTKPMEFSMLVQTAIMNNPNKKQLCQEMLIEGSTGVEITKRLATAGFLRVQPDANDKRSTLLSLTEKGKQTLLKGYTKLEPIHAEFLTSLNPEEQVQFVNLLSRLNDHQTSYLPPQS